MKRTFFLAAALAVAAALFVTKAAQSEPPAGKDETQLNPQQVSELKSAANNPVALQQLFERFALPKKSVVFVNSAGGVVCPIKESSFGLNLIVISLKSTNQQNEPSRLCQQWVNDLRDDETLDRISELLAQLGREDREHVLDTMIAFLAAKRWGISPNELDVILLDVTTSPNERLRRLQSQSKYLERLTQP